MHIGLAPFTDHEHHGDEEFDEALGSQPNLTDDIKVEKWPVSIRILLLMALATVPWIVLYFLLS
jgi:hypothetical protein